MSIHPRIADNPARLVTWLNEVLPAAAVGAEMRSSGDPMLLYPEEAVHLGRAVQKRAAEFAAGRLCARRALAAFGLERFPVEVAPDRQPVWPAGFVGSISHTGGLCLAAVAPRDSLAAVGLDVETVGQVSRDLWPSICVLQEIEWLEGLPAALQARAATLLFSAKEAIYKCQYPLTGEWLEFADLTVEFPDWPDPAGGRFLVHPNRELQIARRARPPYHGRYRFHDTYVTAGAALDAAQVQ